MPRNFFLVDGSSYIFRAYYAIKQNLTGKNQVPTNAVFGFKNMMFKFLSEHRPEYMAMIFDHSGTSFRNEIYPEYKTNREKAPDDLIPQFSLIREFSESMNFKVVVIPDVEADDVIGSLALQFQNQTNVTIISGDKDLTQLVSPKIEMFDTMRKFRFTSESVKEKFGVPPESIREFLALMGDSSDNIPGAAGIGKVTAAKLLNEYGNLENLKKNLDSVKGKVGEKLKNDWANVELSLRLTGIKTELDLGFSLEDFKLGEPNFDALEKFYNEMNFRQDFHALFDKDTVSANISRSKSQVDRSNYETVESMSRLHEILDRIAESKKYAFDLETTSLNFQDAEIVGISVSWAEGAAAYIPVGHTEREKNLNPEETLKAFAPIFRDNSIEMVGQNLKYDLQILENVGVNVQNPRKDTLIEAWLLDSNSNQLSLEALARNFLDHSMIPIETLIGKGKEQISFAEVPVEKASEYAAEDADVTYRLHRVFEKELEKNQGLRELYEKIEIPVNEVLRKMERIGIKIDRSYLEDYSKTLEGECKELEAKVFELAGEEFNLNSTKQLQVILFEKMGITEGKKKTKTGYSTDASFLEKIAGKYPIADYLLQHRMKTKLINTYLTPLPKMIHPKSGRVHTHFNQCVTATGRLSSNKPNLQNIPIRGEDRNRVRKAFVAEGDKILLAADYSQIEIRILAHFSEDPNLISAICEGKDIHSETAAIMFEKDTTHTDTEKRQIAKTINFGVIYGMGAYSLAQQLGIPNSQAKSFIDSYFLKYPNISQFIGETKKQAHRTGQVETLFHRIRRLPDIHSSNHMMRSAAERVAVNTVIQGSAADIMKIAMIEVAEALRKEKAESKLILQVHDELVLEVPKNEIADTMKLLKNRMCECVSLKVPLEIEIGEGLNWADAK